MFRLGFIPLVVVGFFVNAAVAADVKSGPQVGEKAPGPLHPLNCTGDHEGEKYCLYCKYGDNPVAAIFARQVSPEVIRLIKKIDQATGKNNKRSIGSYAVFLSETETLAKALKEMAKKEGIQHCVLALDDPEGPRGYNIAPEAEVTVVLYAKSTIKANHAFKKGELNDKGVEAIVADLTKILSE